MSEGRKRSRKCKLEVRDYCGYEIMTGDGETKSPELQFQTNRPLRVLDHDYCFLGKRGYVINIPCNRDEDQIGYPHTNSRSEPSVEVDSETVNAPHKVRKRSTNSKKTMETRERRNKNRTSIKMCKYNPETIYSVSDHIASTSQNIADKILDIEMRNLWGSVLCTPHELDPYDKLLQIALDAWLSWFSISRNVRDGPLLYQCHICYMAWWRYYPFRQHIKTHPIKDLKVTLEKNYHESMLVASYEEVTTLTYIDIEEDCWRCGKSLVFHMMHSDGYTCSHCHQGNYTCVLLKEHELRCLQLKLPEDTPPTTACSICMQLIESPVNVDKHMIEAHTPRSDIPMPTMSKLCSVCGQKYFMFSTHNCCRSARGSACKYCCRKFAMKSLALSHMVSPYNRPVSCKICKVTLLTKCMELEHMHQVHSNNYQLAFKCTICTNQYLLFIDELSIKLHKELWHNKKSDKRRAYYEMLLVPRNCLQESNEEATLPPPPYEEVRDSGVNVATLPELRRLTAEMSEPQLVTSLDVHRMADVDITVDGVHIKKEPHYNDNGEVDYEELLNEMFCTKSDREEPKTLPGEDKTGEDDMSNFDYSHVKIKAEPLDDIEIHDHPIELVQVKLEPVEDMDDAGQYEQVNENIDNCHSNTAEKSEDKQITEESEKVNEHITGKSKKDNKHVVEKSEKVREQVAGKSKKDNKHNVEKSEKVREQVTGKSKKDNKYTVENLEKVHQQITENDHKEYIEIADIKVEPDLLEIKSEPVEILKELSPDDNFISELLHVPKKTLNPNNEKILKKRKYKIRKKGTRKMHICKKCGYTNRLKEYQIHVALNCAVIPGSYVTYDCSKCNNMYYTFRDYLQHLDRHGFDMTCPVCGLQLDNLAKFSPHLHRHIKSSFVQFRVLNESGVINNEDRISRLNRKYKCTTCHELVVLREIFPHWERHLSLDGEPRALKRERPELSVDCERVTINNKTLDPVALKLALDSLTAVDTTAKECVVCYRMFARRLDLKRHIVEHLLMDAHMNKVRNECFKCQVCMKGFERPEKYKFHMREHGNMPIYKCELCNKTFSDSSNFAKHKKTHNVRVLICDLCNKKFHGKSTLEKHIMLHSSLPKTKCMYCTKTFHSKSSYKKHRYSVHERSKFKCVLCDLTFTSLQSKWDHNWEVHKERKDNADCPICLKSFRKFQDVRLHAKVEHNSKLAVVKQRNQKVCFYQVKDIKEPTLKETLIFKKQ